MSRGTRRINYTSRKRITRDHVQVTIVHTESGELPSFRADLALAGFKFADDGRVFVEAYRHTAWQRFDFGSVKDTTQPADCTLTDFGAAEGIQFRVKVVEPVAANGIAPRILGQADGIVPRSDGPARSMLPLESDPSLIDEVWKLDIDEDSGPLIRVSTHLVQDRAGLAQSQQFISLALPEILRRILQWALDDGVPDDEDWETVRGRWVLFACGIMGQKRPPDEIDDNTEGAEIKSAWIEDAVTRFSRSAKVGESFSGWWNAGIGGGR